jgi:hypothetical protein
MKKPTIITNTRDIISEVYTMKYIVPSVKARRGTTEKFRGCLSRLFPELDNLTENQIDELK